jgi:D-inositol-3-phosphate glycosyltransferase
MRILYVTEYFEPHIGGVEVVFGSIVKRMIASGQDVKVITSRIDQTKEEEISSDGIKIYRVNVPHRGDRYWFTILSIPKIWNLSKNADIIHTTTWNAAFPSWLIGKLRHKPCLLTVHETNRPIWQYVDIHGLSLGLHKLYENMLFSLHFDKYTSVSQYTKNCMVQFFKISPGKIEVIYNGIDYSLFDPGKADGSKIREKLGLGTRFVYLYFGRPGVTKGLEYLIRAVPIINQKIPGSRLLLILAKDPQDRYQNTKAMIKELKIEEEVILFDPVSRTELPNYISASDCVVIPSLSEGFGFSAAEACAMDKPLVVTNVAALPEVVSGEHVLIEPRSADEIAEGVYKIAHKEASKIPKKFFSWNQSAEDYLKVYKDLIVNRNRK